MPTLNWIGKDKVVNYAAKVPVHALNHVYNHGGDIGNKIIHGDNLTALKSLLPLYEGRVKCIYIDPPYNTGNEGWVYNDNVNSPQIQKWLGQVVGKEGEDLTRHDKWLCMMYPRLKLLKQLLADDGAIFISIDDNEVAALKFICDEIFGSQNFIAQFAWKRKKEISNDSRNVSTQGEYILSYSKSFKTELLSESLSDEYIKKSYRPPTDEFPLDFWRPVPITLSVGLNGGGYEYAVIAPNGTLHKKFWTHPKQSYEKLFADNRIYFGKNGDAIPQRVIYLFESKGKPVSNYWDNVTTNKDGKKELLSIFGDNFFDTPKPVALISKILKLATDKNSIVLDAFAGSGTTAHAVINLNAADGGNRKFILIEMENYAETITAERVRRVGGAFDYYEVGEPLFVDGDINPNVDIEQIRAYVWAMETATPYEKPTCDDCAAFMGVYDNTAYYFHEGALDYDFLATMRTRADFYIIFAETCAVGEEFLHKHKIYFKKIPRDIIKIWADEI